MLVLRHEFGQSSTVIMVASARFSQLVRSLTANQKVLGSIPSLLKVELKQFTVLFAAQKKVRMHGGALGLRAPPPPHLKKSSAQKSPNEERKFRRGMSARKNAHSAQIRQN